MIPQEYLLNLFFVVIIFLEAIHPLYLSILEFYFEECSEVQNNLSYLTI